MKCAACFAPSCEERPGALAVTRTRYAVLMGETQPSAETSEMRVARRGTHDEIRGDAAKRDGSTLSCGAGGNRRGCVRADCNAV